MVMKLSGSHAAFGGFNGKKLSCAYFSRLCLFSIVFKNSLTSSNGLIATCEWYVNGMLRMVS